MNKFSKLFITAIACLALTTSAFAQFEGKVTMKMEALELPAEYEPMRSMFESTIVTYIKGNKSRTEAATAMTGTTITISDADKRETYTCMDVMGQKMASKTTFDETQKEEAEAKTNFKKLDETKTIAGYKCKKGVYTAEAGGEAQEIEVWYTEEISNASKADMREIPGLTMEMLMSVQGIKLRYIVTEVKKEKVANNKFDLPEGYRIVTADEMSKKLMGQ
jgi:GLPGLI family protein